MTAAVGRSRARIAHAKQRLRQGWQQATLAQAPLVEGPAEQPPRGAQAAAPETPAPAPALPAERPAGLPAGLPDVFVSRRRLLQVAAAVATAGLGTRLLLPERGAPDAGLIGQLASGPYLASPAQSFPIVPAAKPPAPQLPERKPLGHKMVDRRLALYNENTGEKIVATYWAGGDYVLEELEPLFWLLRDHHVDEMHAIDLRLLDALHALELKLELNEPLHVLSAYRTPQTNAKLAERYDGVARHSFHMEGQAVDLRAPGRSKKELLRAAQALRAGGVGNYRQYVHLDTGPRRFW